MSAPRSAAAGLGALLLACSCGDATPAPLGASQFHIEILSVNGKPLLPGTAPFPANRGDRTETWTFTVEARTPDGRPDPTFDGTVRLSTRPGAITKVIAEGAVGRNLQMKAGEGAGTVELTAVYGPSRLWVDDLGYVPAKPGTKPACSNGKDDDGDVLVDYPADPGCAFADDDTEEGGTYAAGASNAVSYALPKVSDVQGDGPASTYPFESLQLNTSDPQHLIVTRVASDGFYVTDVSPGEVQNGYNSIFAFNFSTPAGMRVCDHVTFLSGTVNEFFGFTELSFPSYQLDYPVAGQAPCAVPEPTILDKAQLGSPVAMEKVESGLVRVLGYHVAANFGPKPVVNNAFTPDSSNCDLNGDGQIDYTRQDEGSCSNACAADPECSEWTSYSARGDFKISKSSTEMIQIQTGTVSGFDPVANKGLLLDSVTGTLRNFSGGSLNWTIEARCPDDLACGRDGCVPEALSSQQACVRLRTQDDNDQGTN